jgi:hypothetical protein
MHALGHGIGLDVHDPWPSTLQPGVPFTIEPGVYVRPNLFEEVIPDTPRNRAMIAALTPAFERYRGIGVRIEDDYVITENGVELIAGEQLWQELPSKNSLDLIPGTSGNSDTSGWIVLLRPVTMMVSIKCICALVKWS